MALDLELLKKEFQEAMAQQATEEYWVPDFGENVIRILPPADGKLFYKKVGVHYRLVGSGMEYCPKVTEGSSCPVCEVVDQLRRMKAPVAAQIVNRLVVVERFLMNIIPLKEGEERLVRQYLAPKTVRLALLKITLDPDYGDITDLETGRNVVIEKIHASGGFVNYSVRAKPKQMSLKEILGRQLRVEEIPDLNEFVRRRLKGYDDLKYALYGGEELGVEGLMEMYSGSPSFDDQSKVERPEDAERKEEADSVKSKFQGGQLGVEEVMKLARRIVEQLKQDQT
jgi:hypothetical protein